MSFARLGAPFTTIRHGLPSLALASLALVAAATANAQTAPVPAPVTVVPAVPLSTIRE
jgi:hypothetical protein